MNTYNKLQTFYLQHFLLLLPLCIILLACVGAFAAYYITLAGMTALNFTLLVVSVIFAMGYLTAILGQIKPVRTFNILMVSLLIEIGLVALQLIL
ncbi:MAG: hypothetical protein ACO3SY_02345 [Flavobacteriaceae bacterium]|jgi:hypothetical protein